MWNCKHCDNSFDFIKTADKANHSRWCDKNPKLNEYKTSLALRSAVQAAKDRKYGVQKSYTVLCHRCSTEFEVTERESVFPSKKNYYCSRSCANKHEVTSEHRAKTSASINRYNTLVGKISIKYQKKCLNCEKEFTTLKKTGKFCSNPCAIQKRTELARSVRSALVNYRADCAFRFNLSDYPEEFDFTLVEAYGWYKAKNNGDNPHGVSRDHMVSVRYGFDNHLPAEHIRHPANCRLILQSHNVSKGTKNFLTYDQLLSRIAEWDNKYNIPKD